MSSRRFSMPRSDHARSNSVKAMLRRMNLPSPAAICCGIVANLSGAHGSGGVKCDRSRSGSTRLHTLPMSGSSDRSQCTPHSS